MVNNNILLCNICRTKGTFKLPASDDSIGQPPICIFLRCARRNRSSTILALQNSVPTNRVCQGINKRHKQRDQVFCDIFYFRSNSHNQTKANRPQTNYFLNAIASTHMPSAIKHNKDHSGMPSARKVQPFAAHSPEPCMSCLSTSAIGIVSSM